MADLYWVYGGVNTNWSTAGNWRVGSSGGSVSAAAPLATDNVFFDAAATGTVTVTTSSVCNDITVSAASSITLAGSGTWSISGSLSWPATGFTRTYTGAVTFAATSTGKTILTNGTTLTTTTVTFNGVGGGWTLSSALTCGGAMTLTNGAINLSTYTLTCASVSSSNSNTRSIAFGTGNITVTGNNVAVWGLATLTGYTYTGTAVLNCTYSGATGTRTIQNGNTAGGAESNAISVNVSAGTDILTFSSSATNAMLNIDLTGFAGTHTSGAYVVYGNYKIVSGITWSANANAINFKASSGTQKLTTGGVTIDQAMAQNNAGATLQLQDNVTLGSTRTFTLAGGTLDMAGKTLSASTFAVSGTTTRAITFNGGTITLSGVTATTWNATGSGFTSSAGTGTGLITMTGSTAKTFVGNGYNYAATLNQGGAGALTIADSNTFYDITSSYTATAAATITLTSGTTQTVTQFTASGTSGNLLTLNSTTPGSAATLSDSSGTNAVTYTSLTDSTATGGATWTAYLTSNNVDGGGNTGWAFNTPVTASNSSFIALRSMAQRGRF